MKGSMPLKVREDKNTICIENTLFLGNGFPRVIFNSIPSWGDLFKKNDSNINNYTFLYEKYVLNYSDKLQDNIAKNDILKEINTTLSKDNINANIFDINKFGEYLIENNVHNIITTNYDNGIECILCDICLYTKEAVEELRKEEIYNIRTYDKFVNHLMGHEVKLWKIHGDVSRIKSITLGFDQYCGFLSKLSSYIKGEYSSKRGYECRVPILEKCKTGNFDNLSWAELFFNTNVYIVGFGMDFSEIDVWWLLNKHARSVKAMPIISNKIYYLFNKQYDDKVEKASIFEALKAFNVECRGIRSDENYIRNIFKQIQK